MKRVENKLVVQNKNTPPETKNRLSMDLTEEQRQKIKKAFDLFDTESTGVIDIKELKIALRALRIDPNKEEIIGILQDIEENGDGVIKYKQFMDIMAENMV